MGWGDPYLDVSEFKARTRSGSTANDDAISAVLVSASRSVDGYCGRTFNHSDGDEYRLFADCWWPRLAHPVRFTDEWPRGWRHPLEIGDAVSVTEVASDDGSGAYATAWDVDTYFLSP